MGVGGGLMGSRQNLQKKIQCFILQSVCISHSSSCAEKSNPTSLLQCVLSRFEVEREGVKKSSQCCSAPTVNESTLLRHLMKPGPNARRPDWKG